jgi:hypothetical protein
MVPGIQYSWSALISTVTTFTPVTDAIITIVLLLLLPLLRTMATFITATEASVAAHTCIPTRRQREEDCGLRLTQAKALDLT